MRDANLDTSNIYETERAEASRGLGGAMGAASLSRRTVLGGAGTAALAKVDAIPVGGAILVKDAAGKPVILSQPTAGTVVAMTAICTHQGCTVAPAGAQLVCPCHGSVYKSADGSNVSGPAPKPLAAVTVHVVNGEVLPG
jgi:Rieske Fe-S protein